MNDEGNLVIDQSASGYAWKRTYELLEEKMKKRYRAIPCKTVDGNAVLNAFRCDKAFVYENGVKNERKSPIVVISKALNTGENSALISPEILENARR